MDIELIIQKLNKIEDKKGKIKYLESLIFKTKNKKLKKKLIKLLKLVEKNNGKKLSFEEIHSENKKDEKSEKEDKNEEKSKTLDNIVSKRGFSTASAKEILEKSNINLKELDETYKRNFVEFERKPFRSIEENINEKIDYLPKESYLEKEENTREYVDNHEVPEYVIKPKEYILDEPLELSLEGRGVDIRQFAVNIDRETSISKRVEETSEGIGEYKRKEIFDNALESEVKKRKKYIEKLKRGEI